VKASDRVPLLRIEVSGQSLAPEIARWISGVRVQQRLSMPAVCEIVIDGPKRDASAVEPGHVGDLVRLTITGSDVPLFVGEITAMEYSYCGARERELRVRAYDLLHRLDRRQPVKSHVQLSAVDLASELTADLGVSVHADESGPVWPRVMQYRQTDLELLREVAARSGLHFALHEDTLALFTLEGVGDAIPLTIGDTLVEARVEVNAATACHQVTAVAWDPWRGVPHEGNARSARTGRDVGAHVDASAVGGSGERTLPDELAQADDQADALAQGELDGRVAREVVLRGVALGDPRLRAGARISLDGADAALCGSYVLTEVTHTIDATRGFLSEVATAPPSPAVRTRAAVVTTAAVTSVDDPERLGRVKGILPTYGDLETDWMGVLTPGAGTGKGLLMLPDVGDKVLVLFARGDPAQGIVLGGLYGSTLPPDDAGVAKGKVRRAAFLTPGGQLVRLDDDRASVRIENSGGSFVELGPDLVVVHSAAALNVEAPGHPIVIRGKTVEFEQS
jgi:phage baseplate assembly protein gpV/phage protein D